MRKRRSPRIAIDLSQPSQEPTFPIDENAKDTNSGTQERFTQNAKDKEGIAKAAASIPEIFTAEQVKWVFDAYTAIICFTYSILLKTDYKPLQDELSFSEVEKDAMAKPLARICSKYAPSAWAGMTAEIELITCMGIWTVSSFGRAKRVANTEREKKNDEKRINAVTV